MSCAHSPCDCDETTVRTDGGEFCCEACASAPASAASACECPHPGCAGVRSHKAESRRGLDIGPTAGGACAQG